MTGINNDKRLPQQPDHHSDAKHCKERHQRLKKAVRRDIIFVVAGAIAFALVAYVEKNASNAANRLPHAFKVELDRSVDEQRRIIDAGFILTRPMHSYLSRHREFNDALALGNSLLLTLPMVYVIYVTSWKGDFRLSFRLIATHLFRSLCGWFTYLPPDSEFLSSLYDFPEIFFCLFDDCASNRISAAGNFVTFFSGHVSTVVLIANHLYLAKFTRLSICLHCFNWLQIFRLLATRGHYSIDLIIGYVVAVWVSIPAERLGLYYSLYGLDPEPMECPGMIETFETLIGVSEPEDRFKTRMLLEPTLLHEHAYETKDNICHDTHNVHSDTSVRIAMSIVSEMALQKCE